MAESSEPSEEDRQRRLREDLARKRRLAEVFGDALPEQTRDDVDPGEPTESRDEWFKRQVPPHHG